LPAAALGCRESAGDSARLPAGGQSRACGNGLYLRDRLGCRFPLETDRYCRMHVFNSRRLHLGEGLRELAAAGAGGIRLDLIRVTPAQAERAAEYYLEAWAGALAGEPGVKAQGLETFFPEGFTKGHFFRGVTQTGLPQR
jgi:putative protease